MRSSSSSGRTSNEPITFSLMKQQEISCLQLNIMALEPQLFNVAPDDKLICLKRLEGF